MRLSFNEMNKLDIWERYCDKYGMNIYAVNEGFDPNEELKMDIDWFIEIIKKNAKY